MNEPWYEDPDFVKLKKEWYDKLEEEGFQDAESHRWGPGGKGRPREMLNGHGSFSSQREFEKTYSEDKQRFYELCRQFYWYMWRRGMRADRLQVWEQYAAGVPYYRLVPPEGWTKYETQNLVDRWKRMMLKFEWMHDDEDS
jgi:hypothetical protein